MEVPRRGTICLRAPVESDASNPLMRKCGMKIEEERDLRRPGPSPRGAGPVFTRVVRLYRWIRVPGVSRFVRASTDSRFVRAFRATRHGCVSTGSRFVRASRVSMLVFAAMCVAIAALPLSCGGKKVEWNESMVHRALRAANPAYNGQAQMRIMGGEVISLGLEGTGVTDLSPLSDMGIRRLDLRMLGISDISPLKGLSLSELYMEGTGVTDLSPLRGMPITIMYLNATPVVDISPLHGMPLERLSLFETNVSDLSPLRGMPLKMLWINGTRVEDISPLAGLPLVSLSMGDTKVSDLSPLAGSSLKRLHIAGAAVTDLSPLEGMKLTRLIFTPENIVRGIDIPRKMDTIFEIGTSFEGMMSPDEFWRQYDAAAGESSGGSSED